MTAIPDRWTFKDPGVAGIFDRHVREQLPWYDVATGAVAQIARHYIGRNGLVYDLGASTGNIGRAIEPTLLERNARLVAVEESPDMAARYYGPGELVVSSALDVDLEPFDLAICFLFLIFLRPDETRELLARLVERCRYGGAIVVVERMLPEHPYLSIVSSRLTLAAKRDAGVPADEIIAKELSLGGVQRPLRRGILEDFGAVEWFRFGDFAGYVIEREA